MVFYCWGSWHGECRLSSTEIRIHTVDSAHSLTELDALCAVSKFYYNVTLMGWIGIYDKAEKREANRTKARKTSFDHKPKLGLPSEALNDCVCSSNKLVGEAGRAVVHRLGRNLNFYEIKYRWITVATAYATAGGPPNCHEAMIHCRFRSFGFNNCLSHKPHKKSTATGKLLIVICQMEAFLRHPLLLTTSGGKSMEPLLR